MKNPPALILVDIQQGFYDVAYWGGERNNPDAEKNAGRLLQFWREKKWPLFHIQHCSVEPNSPLRPGEPGNQFMPEVTPEEGEVVFTKTVNSAFIGTELESKLRYLNIREVVIAGLTTDHCVSTTVRMAANLGFQVTLIEDATATFNKTGFDGENYSAEVIHKTALASLHEEFARIISTDQLIGQLLTIGDE